MSLNLTDPIFHNDDAAREHLEAIRWPNGPYCPHCGNADPERIVKLAGKSHRKGLHQCNECREHFTVTVGSVMERSHIPLAKWVLGFHLMAASKKGVSAHQLMRMLGLGSYRTAWFMAHRIREAMKDTVETSGPIGGEGKIVEADETYHGQRETPRKRRKYASPYVKRGKGGGADKRVILGLVERGGKTRTFHIQHARQDEFMRLRVGAINGDDISVQNMLLYIAYNAGGIHYNPEHAGPIAKKIDDAANTLLLNGQPFPLKSLLVITEVVLDTIDPLYRTIKA